jgi:hypothetical protein
VIKNLKGRKGKEVLMKFLIIEIKGLISLLIMRMLNHRKIHLMILNEGFYYFLIREIIVEGEIYWK